MIAGDVLDTSAALLNDASKQTFNDAVMLPYLNIAMDELNQRMEENNVQITNETSAVSIINIGTTSLAVPADLVEIQGVYERLSGSAEDFQLMTRVDFIPPFVQILEALIYWAYQAQTIKFLGATSIRDVRINYVAAILAPASDRTATISLINSKAFLQYRTAALGAKYVGEDDDRFTMLNSEADIALERFLNINTKGKQAITTRRKPFMAAYKVRGAM